MKHKLLIAAIQLIAFCSVYAQNVNGLLFDATNTATRDASAAFEINANTNTPGSPLYGGLLLPRVALTGTTDAVTISGTEATSLLVYNTATVSDVTPGFYYWNGSSWLRIISGNGSFPTGSGTPNYLARWITASTLGIGATYDNGTNVGIGTSNPAQALEIYRDNADVGIRLHDPGDYHYAFGIDRSDAGKFKINYGAGIGDADHFIMQSNGNIGIGNAAPGHQLSVGVATSDGQAVTIRGYSNSPASWKGGGAFGYTSANVIMGQLNGVAQIGGHNATLTGWADLALNSAGGNVGIGSASPTGKLDVNGGASVLSNAYLDINRDSYARSGISWYSQSYPSWSTYMAQATQTSVGPHGDLTAPTGTFVNSWALREYIENAGGYGWTFESAANTTTPTIKFEIRASDGLFHSYGNGIVDGNIGIGSNSPIERLDIAGNARATGVMYWGNAGTRTETRDDAGSQGGRSGFYETSVPAPAANWYTGASSWQHLLETRHSNTGNNYAMQLAGSFFDQNLWFRKTNNNPAQAWSRILTTNDLTTLAGTTNYLARWTSATSLGIGVAYDDGTNVGIGITSPQKRLDVLSNVNDFVTVGANTFGVGQWTGIHFGYRENNSSYRKSAIVFERTDNSGGGGNAAGKIHILNGPATGAGSATLADSRLTIGENGNVGIATTAPIFKLHVAGDVTMDGDITAGTSQLSVGGTSTVGKRMLMGYDTNGNGFGFIKAGNYGVAWTSLALQPNGGSVGIGTSAPSAQLHTSGTVRFANYPNGILGTDASGNLQTRSIAISGSGIAVTNGNGVAGNPTLNLNYGSLLSAPGGNTPLPTGNFGQFQTHSTYTDFNTNPAYWGWNYVQGTGNAPNATSSQWYREILSLGSEYPGRGGGGYSLELAFPRFNHATAGVWMRTTEGGGIGGWTRIDAGSNNNNFIWNQNSSVQTANFIISGTGRSDGDFRAPIFYDQNNTNYYLNPNGYSNLNQVNISRDGAGECCSGGVYTLSLAESTSGTGRMAGIQFHNGGVSEGYLRLANGGARRLQLGDYQSVGMGLEMSGDFINQNVEWNQATGANYTVGANSGLHVINNSTVTLSKTSGNATNNGYSVVLLVANVTASGNDITWANGIGGLGFPGTNSVQNLAHGIAGFRVYLQRSTDNVNWSTLISGAAMVGQQVGDFYMQANGLTNATGISGDSYRFPNNVSLNYIDNVGAGTYYYRLLFETTGYNKNGGNYLISDRALSVVEIKR
jgi:hypothetical protein